MRVVVFTSALILAVLLPAMPVAAQEPGRRLVWSDEFNQPTGSEPDSKHWVFALGHGDSGWGNHELEDYTDSKANCSVVDDPEATDGKALAIRAISGAGGITSARINTQGLFSVKYGLIEARMRLPSGRGMWPAFWMLGDGFPKTAWPGCGEIDIMENLGQRPAKIYGTVHGPGYSGAKGIQGSFTARGGLGFDRAYHVFAVDWEPGRIRWLVDGTVYSEVTPARLPKGAPWVFDQPFFILLNFAVGGDWPGYPDASAAYPQTLLVDYVRVYSADR